MPFPAGLVSVVQTPFDADGAVDADGLQRVVADAVAAGVNGFVAPVVASEVHALSAAEREAVIELVVAAAGPVPVIVGASSTDVVEVRRYARQAEAAGCSGVLVAVPDSLRTDDAAVVGFFAEAADGLELPLLVQDLQWDGPGLAVDTIARLRERVPALAGLKIETVPAGPAYTAVRDRFGDELYICGGWAVTQLIEALDRGVDAMVPESSMIRVYRAVLDAHAAGDRRRAVELFHRFLPVLAFTNQELFVSIAFCKRLLWRKGIIGHPGLRPPGFSWDRYNARVADELIDHYLGLEAELGLLSDEAGHRPR